MNQIDILITSASRPELLASTIATMQDKLKFSGKFRWLLHEDCINKERSALVLHNAKYSGLFSKIVSTESLIGLGRSIEAMLPYIESPIFFRTDDDWEYIREIDLDSLCDLFDHFDHVNQIVFNKYEIDEFKNNFQRVSFNYVIADIWLTITRSWNWIPALWRTDYTKAHYKTVNGVSGIDRVEEIRLTPDKDISLEWLRLNVGAYFLGKIGDQGTYIKHIGGGQRTIENGGKFGIY